MDTSRFLEYKDKYKYLNDKISDAQVIRDQKKYQQFIHEIRDLEPVIEKIEAIEQCLAAIKESESIISDNEDAEMVEFAREELPLSKEKLESLDQELKFLLIPTDPDDRKNVIMEIRAGTGGDEASLFAADLYRMYSKYADINKFKLETLSYNETGLKGLKEVIFLVSGNDVYGHLKYETGAHRVQRIPETESGGRIHTSACTVAVMPEAEESEVDINDKDLRIETFRAGGAGGQHINTTDSAVRITHIPTNTVVACQDERSQLKNKSKAMKILQSRILENVATQAKSERDADRKQQVGSGDRSERIRTYNYPQNRVTDHRINKTIHKLDMFMEGDMSEIIEALKIEEREKKLTAL